jgi:hypothetical protein
MGWQHCSVWDHPCDEFYKKLYVEEKKKKQTQQAQKQTKVRRRNKQPLSQTNPSGYVLIHCNHAQLPVLTSLQTWLGDCRTKRSRRARPAKPPEERTSPSQAPAARRPSRRLGRLVRVAAVARVCTESVRCACLVGRHCTTQDARVWQHAAPRTAHGADNTDDVRVCCRAAPERVGGVGVAANSMR